MVNVVYLLVVFNTQPMEDTTITVSVRPYCTQKSPLIESYADTDIHRLTCMQKSGTRCGLLLLALSTGTCWATIPFVEDDSYKILLLNGGAISFIGTVASCLSAKKLCFKSVFW